LTILNLKNFVGSRASSQYLAGQYGMVLQQQQRGNTPPSQQYGGRGATPPSSQQYGMARPTQRPPSPPMNAPLVQNYGR
jgi:hypothetical protein